MRRYLATLLAALVLFIGSGLGLIYVLVAPLLAAADWLFWLPLRLMGVRR